ncbi:hypothetical protein V8C40DRAFT_4643 [Trichoderma camerunense]
MRRQNSKSIPLALPQSPLVQGLSFRKVGIMTRGQFLRNQPKPAAEATEADEVTGKRQCKPVQLFDSATQDVSRSSIPEPITRPRRRKIAKGIFLWS